MFCYLVTREYMCIHFLLSNASLPSSHSSHIDTVTHTHFTLFPPSSWLQLAVPTALAISIPLCYSASISLLSLAWEKRRGEESTIAPGHYPSHISSKRAYHTHTSLIKPAPLTNTPVFLHTHTHTHIFDPSLFSLTQPSPPPCTLLKVNNK